MPRFSLAVMVVVVVGLAHTATTTAAPATPPVVAGLAREGPDARVRGLVLLGELGCTACHAAGEREAPIQHKSAPDLSSVGSCVHPEYLGAFLSRPHVVKPGTTMPDVLGTRSASERSDVADSLTHYLVSIAKRDFSLQAPDRVAATRGRELFHSVGCVACHSPRDDDGEEILKQSSVPLGPLHRKYSVQSLTQFLEAPHEIRPAGRMPRIEVSPNEAYQIANYLTRETRVPGALKYTLYLERMEEGLKRLDSKEHQAGLVDGFDLRAFTKYREDFAVRFEGFVRITRRGAYRFRLSTSHLGRLRIGTDVVISLMQPGARAATIELEPGLHPIELLYLHVRGAPKLELLMSGPGIDSGPVPRAMLQSEREPAASLAPFAVDASKAARGKSLFTQLSCNRCHRLVPAEEQTLPPLSQSDVESGCLSGSSGDWPSYSLSSQQTREIRAVLAGADFVPTPEQEIRQTLLAFNCIACHARGEWGGVTKERNDYWQTVDPNLGEPGRLPPPLTGVGAKLQPKWLRNTLANGQRIRPYMSMRMPGFGADNVGHLAELFHKVDHLPAVTFEPLPRDRKKARAVRDIGHRLVGTQGMSCITCHTFRGRGATNMASLDIVETTTQRLKKDWFYHYLLNPVRFRATTIMPQFFPDGVSVLKDIADGDPKRQINAVWHYLSEGRNTRAPRGLTRPSMEIAVKDEAVILRRSAPEAGKRGISVGYPLGVNLIFDAESVSLVQVWWGKFIDPAGVWTGQGSGRVRVIPRDRLRLGKGPPFAVLADAAAPWPVETSRDLGIRFKGYDLDEHRRPTFRYVFQGVVIRDKPLDLPGDGGTSLRRRLLLESATDKSLYFRVAVHPEIKAGENGSITVGKRATISVADRELIIRADLKHQEAVVPVDIRAGHATLILNYFWREKTQ